MSIIVFQRTKLINTKINIIRFKTIINKSNEVDQKKKKKNPNFPIDRWI